ncbi:MAG: amidase [Pseudomonadales bacterium]|jgi:amidase|nr:amidase [Pseudomonadales bacterium]
MSEDCYTRLVDLAEAIRRGELSSEAVTRSQLERIARLDPHLHAFAQVFTDDALLRARHLDAERAAGRPLGPLHGVPLAVKDLLEVAGHPCGVGSPVFAQCVAERDATTVARLKAAGAVLLGTLQLTEGAFSNHHPDIEAPRNPWAVDHWPGVSSSGSGVATAAGLCFGALGTDTGGSIRFPSAACGLVGVKATYGRVSRAGAFPLAESLDHIGPMARSVRDAARLLAVVSGHDDRDPTSLAVPVPDYEAALTGKVKGLRIGIDDEWIRDGVQAEVVHTALDAAELIAGGGAARRAIRLPDASALISGWAITCGTEAALAHAETFPAQRRRYGPALAALLDLGHRATAMDYAAIERAREHYRRALDRVFEQVDLLVLPAMPFTPPSVRAMDHLAESEYAEPITFTAPFDYSGHPCVTVPAGFTSEGMPLAFQLVGAHLSEAMLLRVADYYERETGGAARHPML